MTVTADVVKKRARARELFERQGLNYTETGAAVGVSRETVRRWACSTADPWKKPEVMTNADGDVRPLPTTEELEEARMRAEKARQEARTRWGVRRSEEADAAGLSAGAVRQKIMEEVNGGRTAEARQLALVYATFINSAQLLSGDSTTRQRGDGAPGPHEMEPRPTSPQEMAAAGKARALALVRPPAVDAASREAN